MVKDYSDSERGNPLSEYLLVSMCIRIIKGTLDVEQKHAPLANAPPLSYVPLP